MSQTKHLKTCQSKEQVLQLILQVSKHLPIVCYSGDFLLLNYSLPSFLRVSASLRPRTHVPMKDLSLGTATVSLFASHSSPTGHKGWYYSCFNTLNCHIEELQ